MLIKANEINIGQVIQPENCLFNDFRVSKINIEKKYIVFMGESMVSKNAWYRVLPTRLVMVGAKNSTIENIKNFKGLV